MKKWLGALTLSMTVAVAPVASAESINVTNEYDKTAKYIVNQVQNPVLGNEWEVLSLARGDYAIPANYFQKYYGNVEQLVKEKKGIVHNRKPIENAKLAIAVTAIGKDAKNVAGYDLFAPLADYTSVTEIGIMGPVWTLIALDSRGYDLPNNATTSRKKLVNNLVERQLPDGGFNLIGSISNPDVTAMTLQALAPYKDEPAVAKVITEATATLANLQTEDGAYLSLTTPTSESTSQVLTALVANGINPQQDERFTKVLANLLSYRDQTGGFKHVKDAKNANPMATQQGAYTLATLKRQQQNKSSLYDMKDSAYQFIDLFGHWAHPFAMEAKRKGIINGTADGTFNAEGTLTRAQAASILARTLKLQATSAAPYTDTVTLHPATQSEIAAVYEAGIIKNINGKFNPQHKVTREQLALMLLRAYTEKHSYEPTTIAPLADIKTLTAESQKAITMLYDFDIAKGVNGKFSPAQSTTRAQAAKMFSNFDNQLNK